jgi:hypothetical protein
MIYAIIITLTLLCISLFIWGSSVAGLAQHQAATITGLRASNNQLIDQLADNHVAQHAIVTRLCVARELGPEALKAEVNDIVELLIFAPRTTDGDLHD